MYTIFKYISDTLSPDKRKLQLQEKFNIDFQEIEDRIAAADFCERGNQRANRTIQKLPKEMSAKEHSCYKKEGVITSLKSDSGVINNSYLFEFDVSSHLGEMQVGYRVSYLAYRDEFSDFIKIVRILEILDRNWTEEKIEKNIDREISVLRENSPEYFNTTSRYVLGIITHRLSDSITVETETDRSLTLKLDKVIINFVPRVDDRVKLFCKVQIDEKSINKQGEILEVQRIEPTRIEHDVKCTVIEIHKDWGGLDNNCYFLSEISSANKLNINDIVLVDMIESDKEEYRWRCIKMAIQETTKPSDVLKNKNLEGSNKDIIISDNLYCIFDENMEKQELKVTVTNNSCRTVVVQSIEWKKRTCPQVSQIDPKPEKSFEVPKKSVYTITFLVEPEESGSDVERFIINFDEFSLKRTIKIFKCENKKAADKLRSEKENVNDRRSIFSLRNNFRERSHFVLTNQENVVPGDAKNPKRRFIKYRLESYDVPNLLKDLYLKTSSKSEMFPAIEKQWPALRETLSFENYVARFRTLMHLEELELHINFRQYDMERAFFVREGEYLSLTIENLSERRPSLCLGDSVRAVDPWDEKGPQAPAYEGLIQKVLCNKIMLKFNAGFQSKYNSEDYRLTFYYSRVGLRRQHCAIARMVRSHAKNFIFPLKVELRDAPQLDIHLNEKYELIYKNKTCEWYNENLNNIQKDAIHKILRGETKQMAYIIFGPPGTGKTMTVVEAILQLVKLLPNARLLVGTPSNSSADLITSRLIKSNVLCAGDFIRLVSYNQIDKDLIPDEIMPYCATADFGVDGSCKNQMETTSSGLKMRCQMKFLGRHRVTISTCSTLGNFMQMNFSEGHFTHCIIDEAGQCTEPQIMAPICQVCPQRGQVILVGDPNQLQAIVLNRYVMDNGLSTSFLERILQTPPYLKDILRYPKNCGYNNLLVTQLIYNYRALPSILKVYNELFYNSELSPMVSDIDSRESKMLKDLLESTVLPRSKTRSNHHGVFFYSVYGTNKQDFDSPSWYNEVEAKNVFLMTIQLYRHNISPDKIGIITPYIKQVKQLRNLFYEADIAMPKIGSVEEFQGQERDIILISTVRSCEKLISTDLRFNLGFVQSAKRMNVAISRPRYLLCVFGNPDLLSLDHAWRNLIQYCLASDAYVGEDLPKVLKVLNK